MNVDDVIKLVEALAQLLGILATIIIGRRFANTRILGQSLNDLNLVVQNAVRAEYQKSVKDLKDPSQPGEWNDVAKAAALRAVRSVVLSGAGAIIQRLAGLGMSEATIASHVSDMIESNVLALKEAKTPLLASEAISVHSTGIVTGSIPSADRGNQ